MRQNVKKLQEYVPFDKYDAVKSGIAQKSGDTQTYEAKTFGVEFELSPESQEDRLDQLQEVDVGNIAHIINKYGSSAFHHDYSDWVFDRRTSVNKYRRSGWDDSYGPIDVDTWLEDHEEPERRDYDDDDEYDDAHADWENSKDEIEHEYSYWERRDSNDYIDEFTKEIVDNGSVENYIDLDDLLDRLHIPYADNSRADIIMEVSDWLVENGEKVSPDEEGHKDMWGVGTDGDNVEIRSKHMTTDDVPTLIGLMNFIRDNKYTTTGGTSAHVHVGIPEGFDYFDLLTMLTLVDENRVKTDAGPDRKFSEWASLRTAVTEKFLKATKAYLKDENERTMSASELRHFLRYTFSKYQGTNIGSFFDRRTVEFRYFSSKMVNNPKLFVQWVKYFMMLPAVAAKRNRVTFVDPATKVSYTATRQSDGQVKLSRGKTSDANKPVGDLKQTNPTAQSIDSTDGIDRESFTANDLAVKKHLNRLMQRLKTDSLSDREAQLLPRLQNAWQQILDKKPVKI